MFVKSVVQIYSKMRYLLSDKRDLHSQKARKHRMKR